MARLPCAGRLAPTNKSLAQMSKTPDVAAAFVQKMHLDQETL
jgi:hypothetical protein